MEVNKKELYSSDVDHPELGSEAEGVVMTLAFGDGDECTDIKLSAIQVRKLRKELAGAEFNLFGRID